MHLTGDENGDVLAYGNKADWEVFVPLERAIYLIKNGLARIVSNTTICKLDGQNTETGYVKKCIIDRDQNTCVFCRKPAVKIHQIKPKYLGGKFTTSNCVVACDQCKNEQNRYMQKLYPAIPKRMRRKKSVSYVHNYIIHCDASYKKKQGAILGFVFYKNNEIVYKNCIKSPSVCDSNIAELLAIRESIKFIKKNKIQKVLVVSDSKNSIDTLNKYGKNKLNVNSSPLISQICKLLYKTDIELKWVNRKQNKVADSLTRKDPKDVLNEVIAI